MACQVKRSNDVITKVLLPDGKTESVLYKEILNDILENGIPQEVSNNVLQSLEPYVGKIINNTSDPRELALGLYANMYTNDFKDWYGDWTVNKNQTNIKPRVDELFSSNPELANQVYEALGFNGLITSNDKIIWGHPTIGKTTAKTKNNFLDFDTDFKPLVAQKLGLPKDKQNSIALNEWRKNNSEEEFNKAMREVWEIAKQQASSQNKKLFVSDMLFLRENASDFDKVINTPVNTFVKRASERGDNIESLATWKSKIDTALNNISKSKIITTDKYLSDLFITPQQEQQAKQLYSQYLDTIFPDSKVKDIVYHGSNVDFTKQLFKRDWIGNFKGIYFYFKNSGLFGKQSYKFDNAALININKPETSYDKLQELIRSNEKFAKTLWNLETNAVQSKTGKVYHGSYLMVESVDNTKSNIKYYERVNDNWVEINNEVAENLIAKNSINGDGILINNNQAVVFEPEQIHILGSKQDIEGFKEFIRKENFSEPKLINYNDVKVIKNEKGEIRSIYNLGKFRQTKEQFFKSVATKRTQSIQSQVRKVIDILNFRITEARKQRDKVNNNPNLSFEEKTKRSKYFNDVIKTSIQRKEVLKNQNSIDYIFITAESDLDMADDVLTKSSKATMGEIRLAYKAVETWKNIYKILNIKDYESIDEKYKTMANMIEGKTADLSRRLTDLSVKLIAKTYSTQNNEIKPDELYNYLKGLPDIDIISSYARDITGTGIPLVNVLAKIIQKANLEISKEHNRIYDIIDEEYNKIKAHPEITKNGYSIFFKEQLNNAKDKTLGLVGRYSQRYYDKIRAANLIKKSELEKAGDNFELKKKVYDSYNAFISKNTILFDSAPFVNESKFSDEDRQAVIDNMKNLGFTNNEVADIIKEAKTLYTKYEQAKERYKIGLDVDLEKGLLLAPNGMTDQQYLDMLLKEWEDEYDPLQYINQMKNTITGKYAYKGGIYTIKVARKTIDGKDSGYYDQNFAKIANDPQLYSFYNFFKNNIRNTLSYFPNEEVDDLQSNFLPVVTEKLAKEYGISNLKSTITNMDWLMNMFTTIDYEKNLIIDPGTGKEVFNLKSKFIDEVVPIEQRSKDMVTMMKMFTDMGLIYKHKLQVQDYVDTINEIVKNTKDQYELNEFNEKISKPEAPKNLQAMVEYEVKKSFYGLSGKSDDLIIKGRKFYHAAELIPFLGYKSEKYKKAKQLEDEIKQLRKEIDSEDINELDRGTKLKEMYEKKSEYNNLGGRSISFTAMGDSSVKYSRLIALALQPFSALRNLAIGGVNNVIHAAGGRDFNKKDLSTATFLIKDSIVKFWSKGQIISQEAAKLLKFMADTGVVEGEDGMFSSKVLDKETTLDKIGKLLPNAFTLMKSTDFIFKSQTAVAMALNQQIKLQNGETISLYKALDDKLGFNEEKYGKYDPTLNNNQSFDELYDNFILRVGQISKKLHGLSTNRTSVMIKQTVLGRMLFLFKSWLPETLASRYEKRKYDELLGREIEGYMRTFLTKAFDEGIGKAVKAMFRARFSDDVNEMDELEKENLRKAFAEISAILTLTMIYLTLKSMAPDDDDEKKSWNIILNQIKLLQRDMLYYFDVSSVENLTAQVIPSFTALVNAKEAFKAVLWHYPAGQAGIEVDESGEPLYDEERTLLKISKAIPILNNYNRILYYEKKLDNVR